MAANDQVGGKIVSAVYLPSSIPDDVSRELEQIVSLPGSVAVAWSAWPGWLLEHVVDVLTR